MVHERAQSFVQSRSRPRLVSEELDRVCSNTFKMDDQKTQEPPITRSSEVVIIGAGFSGINLACQLQRKLGTTDYVIYDRSTDYGGAWFANRCELSHTRHKLEKDPSADNK